MKCGFKSSVHLQCIVLVLNLCSGYIKAKFLFSPLGYNELYSKIDRNGSEGISNGEAIQLLTSSFIERRAKGVSMLNKPLSATLNPLCTGRTSICFHHVGCFNRETGILKHLCRLQEENVNTMVKFYLFYAENPTKYYEVSVDIVSMFKAYQPLAVISHGYLESGLNMDYQLIKANLFASGKYNQVLLVDYEKAGRPDDFVRATANSEYVGRLLGILLARAMSRRNIKPSHLYLIVFSMGCQVVHFASLAFQEATGQSPARITALDPGAPLTVGYPNTQISSNDAHFVDIIHTSAGFSRINFAASFYFNRLGINEPLGHVDFYPNGGGFQPQCALATAKDNENAGRRSDASCKHHSSKDYYMSSFSKCKFVANRCAVAVDVFPESGYCEDERTNERNKMGFWAHPNEALGSMVLETKDKTPWC